MSLNNEVESTRKDSNEEVTKGPSKVNKVRYNRKFRLTVIIILLVIVAILFYFWKSARIALVVAFVALLAALGLEVSQTDFDMQKLFQTGSFQESKLGRDSAGNILFDKLGNITTDSSIGKKSDEYNCSDFSTQDEAQTFFLKVGGTDNDVNRLDGNNDGVACQDLPKTGK